MRIALTKSTLRIPPTYFAVDHAQLLQDRHEFEMFTLAADVADSEVTVPVRDFVPVRRLSFRTRERAIPLFLSAMSRAVRDYRPDVIHQHFATWSKPAVDASAHDGIPLLTTVHGADIVTASRAAHTSMERWHHRNITATIGQSSRVLAVSRYLADLAIGAGFDASRLDVHYHGVDVDFYVPADARMESHEPPLVVFIGALNAQKGIIDLLAASQLLSSRAEHRLAIVGTGPLLGDVTAAAATHPHIEYLGSQPRAGIRALLQRADLLVAPSQDDHGRREAAGLVLLEAQACGVPVVAYDSGGTSEMMDAGTTGILVPERDTDGLVDAIRSIVAMGREERLRIGTAARQFVVTARSLQGSALQLEQHYADVAGSR